MLSIDFRADLSGMQRALFALGADQVPFASALALTSLARGVADLERDEVKATFESPTEFTQDGFAVRSATKRNLVAFVAARKIAATYLLPYVEGGNRSLISRKGVKKGMIVPKNIAVDGHGNLPVGTLRSLKRRRDVFVGGVRDKHGNIVNGFWQRTGQGPMMPTHGKGGKRKKISQPRGGLKLLIRFEDTTPAPEHFPFYEAARAYVSANAKREFDAAFRRALASSKG
ncbi:hypothetical protein [Novosphingobium humi]|uniref:Uncharacterized protein n=1 Tax=Novosphingobium humi TaxID=2282397 RepID=A0ABY7U233_9SPHN|nr:hypothetical protein [Novosphingobium humi]WCT78655.1 hypothetical protein PQ457_06745 [Novosphingobium humi]